MSQLENLLFKLLGPLLDRLGSRWKSALGLFLMAAILAVQGLGYLPERYATWAWHGTELLFGIGVIDKFRQSQNAATAPIA